MQEGTAALNAAAACFDEARSLIEQATGGSARAEPAQAVGLLTDALTRLGVVAGDAAGCKDKFTDYLTDVAGGANTQASGTTTTSHQPRGPSPGRDRAAQLRDQLPARTATNRKTHGRWFVGDRPAQALVSGEGDTTAELAAGYLARTGDQRAAVRAHVEIKLAALIRQRWEATGQNATVTLVINNEICEGDMSCFVFIPRLLPQGCSITVVTPTGRQTFTGESP